MTSTMVLPPLKHWINGFWKAEGLQYRDVVNPATQSVIAAMPQCTETELDEAVQAASDAFHSWSSLSPIERAKHLRAWGGQIQANLDNLAMILTTEEGKPLAEARSELLSTVASLEWCAEEARRVYGEMVAHPQADRRFMVIRQPVGVVGAITPWNFPAGMVVRKVAPALAFGCTVILKPASQTPLTALALIQLAEKAGLPAGVLNIINGSAEKIGRCFASDPRIHKISFTGSTAVGQQLSAWASPHFKRLSMELGGNAPFIIFEDANLDAAIDGVMLSKFRNAGQTCICTNRLYVHVSCYDAVVERLTKRILAMKVGAGDEPGVQMGPLIDKNAVQRAKSWVEQALALGAKNHTGAMASDIERLGDAFMAPVLLTEVSGAMRIVCDEVFAPILPVMPFETEEEVIQKANATPYGLAAYFYSENIGRVIRVAEQLAFGMVGANAPFPANESVPFGGIKHSGYGREGSRHAMEDYTHLKTICIGL